MVAKQRFRERNKAVREFYADLESKHPQWKQKHLITDTAARFYLSTRTIEAILFRESVYAD